MRHARPDYNRIQDPVNLIPADEPVFLVRAQDICGPRTLQAWINAATAEGVDPAMVDLVKQHRLDMMEWQSRGHVKVPDLPPQ